LQAHHNFFETILFQIAFLFVLSHPSAATNAPMLTLEQSPFVIYHDVRDTSYARQAANILTRALEDIRFDFDIDIADNFHIYIMPTRKSFLATLESGLPQWTGAFAVPDQQLMVVKSPRWNNQDKYNHSLVHELVHLTIHRVVGLHTIPRWLDEGLAIFYAEETRWHQATAISKALATRSIIPLSEIDDVLNFHPQKADLAYQQSYSAVRYLLATYDIEALHRILYGLKEGKSINECFIFATGSTFENFEKEWQGMIAKTHRWVWLYELDTYIWALIIGLLILAFLVRQWRNRRIKREWQQEMDDIADMDEN